MAINSMNSRFAMAERMSIPQIQQSVQSGVLPAYVGVPLIEQKMQEQKKAAAMQQLAQAQAQAQQYGLPAEKPIAQGIMEQAAGIEAVPSNLPVAGYNDGGIVAFAGGGEADDEDFDYEEYQDEQDIAEYQNMINAYAAEAEAAGLEGIPINRTKTVEIGVEKKASGGILGLNDGGFLEPIDFGDELDRAREASAAANAALRGINPKDDPAAFEAARQAALKARNSENLLQGQYELNMASDPSVRPATMADVYRARPGSLPPNAPPLPKVDYAPPSASPTVLPEVVVKPERTMEDMDITRDTGVMGGELPNVKRAGIDSVASSGTRTGSSTEATGASPTTRREAPKSRFDEFMDDIKRSREELKKQKNEDKYMALLSAGLGMMSGTSPNPFANIGQGAQAGVATYQTSAKQRAAEQAALNKNLLMGQRYQSMEDIAGRTADINEARYREALAAKRAGAGDAAELKQERLLNAREADLNRAITSRTNAIKAQLETQYGKSGMYTNPNFQKEYNALYKANIAPLELQLNALYAKRSPDLFGPNASGGSGSVMSYVPGKGFVQN